MAKDFSSMEDSNRSSNPSIHDVSDPQRRIVLRGSAVAAVLSLMGPLAGCATSGMAAGGPKLGFKGIPIGAGDRANARVSATMPSTGPGMGSDAARLAASPPSWKRRRRESAWIMEGRLGRAPDKRKVAGAGRRGHLRGRPSARWSQGSCSAVWTWAVGAKVSGRSRVAA